jgi:RNA polymerase sigma factor (sigma-70 family)
MNSVKKNDTQLVSAIKNGGRLRELALRELYMRQGLRKKVCGYISQHGGNWQDGEDMFQEGIIVLDRNIRQGKFREESALESYLFSICKFLWKNQQRKNYRVDLSDNNATLDKKVTSNPEISMISAERQSMLQTLISKLGEKCRKVLTYWQLSYSMKEIAELSGLSSEGMARKTKYQCLKKLIDHIGANNELSEWFEESKRNN